MRFATKRVSSRDMPTQADEDEVRELHPVDFFRGKDMPVNGVRDYRAVPVDVDEVEPVRPEANERLRPGQSVPAKDAEDVPSDSPPPERQPGQRDSTNKPSKGQAGTTPPD